MNRYTMNGMVLDAMDGKTVLVCAAKQTEAADLFDQVYRFIHPELTASVNRTFGREEIKTRSGGRILFRTAGRRVQGITADVLCLNPGIPGPNLQTVLPAARGGELIWVH